MFFNQHVKKKRHLHNTVLTKNTSILAIIYMTTEFWGPDNANKQKKIK